MGVLRYPGGIHGIGRAMGGGGGVWGPPCGVEGEWGALGEPRGAEVPSGGGLRSLCPPPPTHPSVLGPSPHFLSPLLLLCRCFAPPRATPRIEWQRPPPRPRKVETAVGTAENGRGTPEPIPGPPPAPRPERDPNPRPSGNGETPRSPSAWRGGRGPKGAGFVEWAELRLTRDTLIGRGAWLEGGRGAHAWWCGERAAVSACAQGMSPY